ASRVSYSNHFFILSPALSGSSSTVSQRLHWGSQPALCSRAPVNECDAFQQLPEGYYLGQITTAPVLLKYSGHGRCSLRWTFTYKVKSSSSGTEAPVNSPKPSSP